MKSAKLLDELEQKLAERKVLKQAISDLDTALTDLDKNLVHINLRSDLDNSDLLPALYDNLMLELNHIRELAN
jgi:hypothetical protein